MKFFVALLFFGVIALTATQAEDPAAQEDIKVEDQHEYAKSGNQTDMDFDFSLLDKDPKIKEFLNEPDGIMRLIQYVKDNYNQDWSWLAPEGVSNMGDEKDQHHYDHEHSHSGEHEHLEHSDFSDYSEDISEL
jgi:hypothetical protein